jgi:hypothetical protein
MLKMTCLLVALNFISAHHANAVTERIDDLMEIQESVDKDFEAMRDDLLNPNAPSIEQQIAEVIAEEGEAGISDEELLSNKDIKLEGVQTEEITQLDDEMKKSFQDVIDSDTELKRLDAELEDSVQEKRAAPKKN